MARKITQIPIISSNEVTELDSTLIVDEETQVTKRVKLTQILNFITSSVFESLTVNNLTASVSSSITPSDIPNSALINSFITINGVNVELGASIDVGDITYIYPGDGILGGGADGDVTISVDSTVLRTTGNQTVGGIKTFTNLLSGSQAKFDLVEANTVSASNYIGLPTALAGLSSTTVSSSVSLSPTQRVILAKNNISSPVNITLPDAASAEQGEYYIMKADILDGTIAVLGSSSQLVNGQSSFELNGPYQSITLVTDGADWYIF